MHIKRQNQYIKIKQKNQFVCFSKVGGQISIIHNQIKIKSYYEIMVINQYAFKSLLAPPS